MSSEMDCLSFSPVNLPSNFPDFPDYISYYPPKLPRMSLDFDTERHMVHQLSLDLTRESKDPLPLSNLANSTSITKELGANSHDTPLMGQYEYESFDEVLEWIQPSRFDKESLENVKRYIDGRAYFQKKGNSQCVRSVENMVKNSVGIRRMAEDVPDFRKKYFGQVAKFQGGKFLGWHQPSDGCDWSLPGIVHFEIGFEQK